MPFNQPEAQVRAGAQRLGYGPGGIKAGAAAADHMAWIAKNNEGKVPKGCPVAQLQAAANKGGGKVGHGGGGGKGGHGGGGGKGGHGGGGSRGGGGHGGGGKGGGRK